MATAAEKKQAYEQWKEHCKRVQSITDTALLAGETPAQKDRRILRLQGNYAAFCEYYFPHFLTLRDKTTGEVIRTIHNAPFHNAAAAKVKGTPNLKAVFIPASVRHRAEINVEIGNAILEPCFQVTIAHSQLVEVAEHGHIELLIGFHSHLIVSRRGLCRAL